MNWYDKLKFRIGMWMCRRGWHKNKRFVGVDWASRGNVVALVKYCKRCKLTLLENINEKIVYQDILDLVHRSNLHPILSAEEILKRDKEAKDNWSGKPDPVKDLRKLTGKEFCHCGKKLKDGEWVCEACQREGMGALFGGEDE